MGWAVADLTKNANSKINQMFNSYSGLMCDAIVLNGFSPNKQLTSY
jgi:hypothetical protein